MEKETLRERRRTWEKGKGKGMREDQKIVLLHQQQDFDFAKVTISFSVLFYSHLIKLFFKQQETGIKKQNTNQHTGIVIQIDRYIDRYQNRFRYRQIDRQILEQIQVQIDTGCSYKHENSNATKYFLFQCGSDPSWTILQSVVIRRDFQNVNCLLQSFKTY